MTDKRILMTSWGNGTGGADTVVSVTSDELRKRGLDVDVLTHHSRAPYYLESSGRTRRIGTPREVIEKIDWSSYSVMHNGVSTMSNEELSEIAQRNPRMAEIYTAHSLKLHSAVRSRTEYTTWFESLSDDAKRREIDKIKADRRFGTEGEDVAIGHSDRALSMTHHGLSMLNLYYPEHADKGLVLPHGTDISKYAGKRLNDSRSREIIRYTGNGNFILYMGRILSEKGTYDLIDAFGLIKERNPDARLVIVGDSGRGEREKVNKRVNENVSKGMLRSEYQKDVVVVPWVSDQREKIEYYKLAAERGVLVVPSRHETFCMTALEGMTFGAPVVISNVDGPKEIWVDTALAYGMNPGDPENIARRVDYVLSNRSQAQSHARRVKTVVREKYGIDNVVDALLALYDFHLEQRGIGGLVIPKDREQFYATLADLSGDESFREAGRAKRGCWAGFGQDVVKIFEQGGKQQSSPQDRLALQVYPNAKREDIKDNGTTGTVSFYTTNGFKYKGIMVKKAPHNEVDVLRKVPSGMKGRYRIPEVVGIDTANYLVAQQRIFGPDMLARMAQSPEAIDMFMMDAAHWLGEFHGSGSVESYNLRKTHSFDRFVRSIESSESTLGTNIQTREDYRRVGQLLEEKWAGKNPRSQIGLVHGDMSPIHLLYAGNLVYGIDFNASHRGPVNTDPGMFLGNAVYHMTFTQPQLQNYIEAAAEAFLTQSGTPIETGFYLARSYFAKANGAARKGDYATAGRFLRASRSLLEKPFNVSMLKV